MINFLLGAPGGGKSYEAVAFHVLPALQAGRKVITNLPLQVEKFAELNPEYPALIELRTETLAKPQEFDEAKAESLFKRFGISATLRHFNKSAFSQPEDYGDSWRHPESGAGPLYVIDECHIPLPAKGTPIKVEEWFSLHRHESADVLLISQSYGKVNRAINDLIQIAYRVRKNTSFGSAKSYTRKVQDGLRGEVVNTTIRKYEKKYFGLYRSHTKGGGSELAAGDIVPIWKNWTVIGSLLLFVAGGIWMSQAGNPLKPKLKAVATKESFSGELTQKTALPHDAIDIPYPVSDNLEPYSGKEIHFVGSTRHINYQGETVDSTAFFITQNGTKILEVLGRELTMVGYTVKVVAPCVARLQFGSRSWFAVCDKGQLNGPVGDGSQLEKNVAPSLKVKHESTDSLSEPKT
jgi:zona occludens toxin